MSSQILGYSASNALAGDVNSLNGLKNEATNKTPQAAREAAKQLESLFMREMIKSMRQATMKSGLIDQEGGGGDLARDMYDQQLSVSMSGLPGGLSASVAAQIARSMGVAEKEARAGLQQTIGGMERGGFSSPSTVNFASRSGRFTQWAQSAGMLGTAANVNDVTQAHALVHGAETDVFADAGYQGVGKRDETQEINVNWHVAMRPGKRKVLDKSTPMGAILDQLERAKASIRAKVEHPFRVIKRQFGHVKVRYRGLAKNTAQLHTLFALSNLWMVRRTLLQEMRG